MIDEVLGMPEAEEADPGTSFELTDEGWQVVPYTDPEADWRSMPDGSLESPDGRTRSFPLDNPAGV
jgi:hypothetical protein